MMSLGNHHIRTHIPNKTTASPKEPQNNPQNPPPSIHPNPIYATIHSVLPSAQYHIYIPTPTPQPAETSEVVHALTRNKVRDKVNDPSMTRKFP